MEKSEAHITPDERTEWFALRTRQTKAADLFAPLVNEVFYPRETIELPHGKKRERAIIPHVLFIRTRRHEALRLEREARETPGAIAPFWIYRYPADNSIQIISQRSIDLLRLLSADDQSKCEIFRKTDFRVNDKVRVTGGIYKGYEGYVQRVRKNRHVIVKIEGVCMVMLPFIHPDLLEPIS